MAVPLASSQPCGLSSPKALQTQGFNWALAEYYDWVLRQLNDSRQAKGEHGGLPGPNPYVDTPLKFLLEFGRGSEVD